MYNPGYQAPSPYATNPSRPPPLRVKLSNKEKGIYSALFQRADPESSGKVDGSTAVEFFRKSGLPNNVLRDVWNISVPNGEGFLDRERFYVALRLIALAQQGKPCTTEAIMSNIEADVPTLSFQNSPSDSVEVFEIAPEERAKFESIFNNNCGQKGFLTGLEARSLFERTGVGIDDLARIWGMADPRDTGQLTRNQFVVAMQLIVKVRQRVRIPDVLPASLQAILNGPVSAAMPPPAPKPEPFGEFGGVPPSNPSGYGVPNPPNFPGNPPAGPSYNFTTNINPSGFNANPGSGFAGSQQPQPAFNTGFGNNPAFATGPPAAPSFGVNPSPNPVAKRPEPQQPAKRMDAFDDFGEAPGFMSPPKPALEVRPPAPIKPSVSPRMEPSEPPMMPPKPQWKPEEVKKEPAFGFDEPAKPPVEIRAKPSGEDPVMKELLKSVRTIEARMEDLTDQIEDLKKDYKSVKESLIRVEEITKDGKKQRDLTIAMVEEVLKEARNSHSEGPDNSKLLTKQITEGVNAMAGFKSQCEETLKQHQMVSAYMQQFFQQIAALQARGPPQRQQQAGVEAPPVRQQMPEQRPQMEMRPDPPPVKPVEIRAVPQIVEPVLAPQKPVEEVKFPVNSSKQSPFNTGNVEPRSRPKQQSGEFNFDEPKQASSGFDFSPVEQKGRQPPLVPKIKKDDFDFESPPKDSKPGFDFDFDEGNKKKSDFDF